LAVFSPRSPNAGVKSSAVYRSRLKRIRSVCIPVTSPPPPAPSRRCRPGLGDGLPAQLLRRHLGRASADRASSRGAPGKPPARHLRHPVLAHLRRTAPDRSSLTTSPAPHALLLRALGEPRRHRRARALVDLELRERLPQHLLVAERARHVAVALQPLADRPEPLLSVNPFAGRSAVRSLRSPPENRGPPPPRRRLARGSFARRRSPRRSPLRPCAPAPSRAPDGSSSRRSRCAPGARSRAARARSLVIPA
jgi:hypothetical protein